MNRPEVTASGGYYSLIQFCPDLSRAEVANVGVLLFCQYPRFLKAKMARGNKRVARFFGRDSFDADALNAAKHAMMTRLDIDQERFRTVKDLRGFVNTRANSLILTEPRPVRVQYPARELDALFGELVHA